MGAPTILFWVYGRLKKKIALKVTAYKGILNMKKSVVDSQKIYGRVRLISYYVYL